MEITIEEINTLYHAINDVMADIGAFGNIDSKNEKCHKVMAALYDIDGGEYDPALDIDEIRYTG